MEMSSLAQSSYNQEIAHKESVEMASALLTPDDLYTQARRFNVDLNQEPFLLPLLKQAALTQEPPRQQYDHDHSGADCYFLDQIQLLRQRRHEQFGTQTDDSAWMAFTSLEAPPTVYYYDFVTKDRQTKHPLVPLLDSSDNETTDPIKWVAHPQEFQHAAKLHQQSLIDNILELKTLCFHCWWHELSAQGQTRQCRFRLYFAIPTRHFQVVLTDAASVFSISHIPHAVTGVPLEEWDLYEGARISVLGRPTTLHQPSLLTRQWLEHHERRLHPVAEHLQDELAKYELRSHQRKPSASRLLSVNIHRSQPGVSLRQLINDIDRLQKKIAFYRPDLARKNEWNY